MREEEMQDFALTILSLLFLNGLKDADYCYDPDRVWQGSSAIDFVCALQYFEKQAILGEKMFVVEAEK